MEKFAKNVGFSHPRKRDYLLKHLAKGASDTTFVGINESRLCNRYFDLASIKNLRVLGLGSAIRKKRIERGITQECLAKKLGIERKNLTRYENSVLAAPIVILQNILGSKHEMYKELDKDGVKMGIGGHTFIHFPINIKRINMEAYKFLSPVEDYVIIRKRQKGRILNAHDVQKIRNMVDKYFDVKSEVRHGKSNDIIIQSKTLSLLLNRFFIYSKPWKPSKILHVSNYS